MVNRWLEWLARKHSLARAGCSGPRLGVFRASVFLRPRGRCGAPLIARWTEERIFEGPGLRPAGFSKMSMMGLIESVAFRRD